MIGYSQVNFLVRHSDGRTTFTIKTYISFEYLCPYSLVPVRACLYSHEYNHCDRTRCRRALNFAELAALSSGSRTQRLETCSFLDRSRKIKKSSSAPNATSTYFTHRPSSADGLARPFTQLNDVVISLVTRPARHVGLVVFRVNKP